MVLESSHDIQRTTTALLTFNPECLEVTLQGPAGTVAASRSKVVMILDELREQTRSDSNINTDHSFQGNFYDSLLLESFLKKESGSSEFAHILLNRSNPTAVSHLEHNDNVANNKRPAGTEDQKELFPSHILPNWHLVLPQSDSFADVEADTAQSPVESAVVRSTEADVSSNEADPFRKMRSVFTDDENFCEDNILTDMRYSKKIEQALKLGYSEKHVTKALSKLGPDCALNDLLSELIQLGTSDNGSPENMSLEPDAVLTNDALDFDNFQRQTLNAIRWESEESSSFSSSADSYSSSHINPSDSSNLRDIIIDGSNVAMSHGKKVFSCRGIQIAVDWFRKRGHKNITAFVPQWRKETSRPDAPITDQEIINELEKEGIVVFTPARRVKGRRVVCYDDRYILKLAVETDGIVVSNDVYRDLVNEREDFRRVVEQRLLMYSFANDRFMPPEDPLGRLGPTLDNFLRKVPAEPAPRPQDCPYGKKCTYGNKCRFYHPERGFAPQKLITETLKEQADLKLQERATRLSEIAEKAKRSKQKLSRTKSLTPWEPQPPALTSQGNMSTNKQEKPKLTHSRSVMLPVKSSDYLNEPRKKLEEAELARALAQTSLQNHPMQVPSCSDCDRAVKSKSPSPRSSPSPQKDLIKLTTSGESVSRHPQPLKAMNIIPSRASPSHLTVPKPEPPERYLSGHLYLAKKLSDESVESSFFSEHTSSPSSTRTSSPVAPASKILEHTQFPAGELYSKDRQEDLSGLFAFPPPLYPVAHQQHPVYESQGGNKDLENIPNLSIFEHGNSLYSHCPDSSVRRDILDHSAFTDNAFQKLNPCSPDSGLYTSNESILSPYNQPEYPLSKAYPLFRRDLSAPSSEHLSLRRAYSSTGHFRTPEDVHQKLERRASGVSPSYFGDEQIVIKPQMAPGAEKSALFSFGHLYGLNRQNSSSDPQIHTGAGELKNPQALVQPSMDPTRNFPDMYRSAGQHSQLQQQQQRQFENQQSFQRLQQKQQQNQEFLTSQLPQPTLGTWVEYPGTTNTGYRSSMDCTMQNHYNTFQNSALAYGTNRMSYPPPAAGGFDIRSAGMFSYNTPQVPQTPHYQQHSIMNPTQHCATSASEQRRQSFPSLPSYPQFQKNTNSTNQIFMPADPSQTFQTSRSPPMPYILPEDAPILPEDPRYVIYYHLSNVFGEQVVRRVMNQNPNEQSPDDVCKLIIHYKDKTGL
ncbi:unnamed protein product [Candidula unifasciata]|uniref:C3H1-type domain-containing protein n=1 Tax=Candidula unifasciata TaxID=100452 RepID=A0A8S3ZJS7_9EUPU|nr:unnamed protein product [Candidula unifasciata]